MQTILDSASKKSNIQTFFKYKIGNEKNITSQPL